MIRKGMDSIPAARGAIVSCRSLSIINFVSVLYNPYNLSGKLSRLLKVSQ